MKTYVIYKQDGRWVTETKEGETVDRRFYTAKRRAVNGVLIRHPGLNPITMVMDCQQTEGG